MAKNKNMGWKIFGISALVVVLAILVVGQLGILPQASIGGDDVPTGPDGTPTVVTSCTGDVEPSVVISAYDGDNPGTAITEAGIYREKGKVAFSAWTPGSALTSMIVGKTYEFFPGITTTDFLDHAYGESFEYTVVCKNDQSDEVMMYNDEIETSVSATFYNKDDNAAAQTFTAGDIYVVESRLKAGKDEYFGNPTLNNPNMVILKLNVTEWETPLEVRVKETGQALNRVSVPNRFFVESLETSGMTQYAYEMPVITDKEMTLEFELEADGTNAPSVDGTAYFYAGGYFLNSETGEVDIGVETEDSADVATDAADSLTLDFTA